MRNAFLTAALATAVAVAPLAAPVASADPHFYAGSAFRIGGVAFSIVLGGSPRAPFHYWRTGSPLRYRGVRCTDACYFDHGSWFHAASCPVVGTHFHRHDVAPRHVYDRWAPRPRGWDRHGDHGHHRYDRYDRHPRYDRHGRHDDRHWSDRRGDHHRHDHRRHQGRSCPYDR